MDKPLFEEDVEVEIRLPWYLTCRLACAAMIYGLSFNKMVEDALKAYNRRQE